MRNVSKDTANLFDGDIVFSTDNDVIVNSIYPDRLPITYDKESAPPQKLNTVNMIKTDLNTFDCKIGQITNYSTRFFSMLCMYDRDSREYAELVERLKLLRRYIGDSIDAGKGVKTKPFPNEWKSWRRVPEEWDEEKKAEQWFLNNLVEKRKPYFFIYIYPEVKKQYNDAKRSLNSECKKIFGCKFNELRAKENLSQEERNFIRHYYEKLPVTKTPCIMNKIAWKIESLEFDYKYPKNDEHTNIEIGEKLISGQYKIRKKNLDDLRQIFNYYKEYSKHHFSKPWNKLENFGAIDMSSNYYVDEKDSNLIFMENVNEKFRVLVEELIPNERELADHLVRLAYFEKPEMKNFCWTFGGNGIIQNIMDKRNRNDIIYLPKYSNEENGTEYQGRYYTLGEVSNDYI